MVPNLRAGIVNGEQEPGLGSDVLEVADQSGAVLTRLQMLVAAEIGVRLEQLGKGVLKFGTGHGFVHGADHRHAICSFR
jgi:hypothetical protein